MFIILSPEQAASVTTQSLQPRPVGDVFILPLAVLEDPTHEAQWPMLRECARGEVELPEPESD